MFLFLLAAIASIQACKPQPAGNGLLNEYPSHFPIVQEKNSYNQSTKEGIELGKRLFFDPRLSKNNDVSCASCHQQPAAFADRGTSKSVGTNGTKTLRNAPVLFNLLWHDRFLWDGGAPNLERQVLNPLTGPREMDQDLEELIRELNSDQDYPGLFMDAFGTDSIHTDLVFRAIAQYEKTLISANSKYDQVQAGKAALNELESKGMALFMNSRSSGGYNCSNCHSPPLFSDFTFRNNGLDSTSPDSGYGLITGNPSDIGKFKVPSLRNLSFSMPYMHDGRFYTLEQVLDHYSSGIRRHPNLDSTLINHYPISGDEKVALIAFLRTLDDHDFTAAAEIEE